MILVKSRLNSRGTLCWEQMGKRLVSESLAIPTIRRMLAVTVLKEVGHQLLHQENSRPLQRPSLVFLLEWQWCEPEYTLRPASQGQEENNVTCLQVQGWAGGT